MIKTERFINELMSSNCYLVVDGVTGHCLCIDPGSEKSDREINYIDNHYLTLDYIILTHEHTDHTWGCNVLKNTYPEAKVVCSESCKKNLKKEIQSYFLYYYDNPDYHYKVCNVDLTTEELDWNLEWGVKDIRFIPVPGHSMGSICISIEDKLFTGDAILQSKPYINKRNGSKDLFYESVKNILGLFPPNTLVCPGHGETFFLREYNYRDLIR